MTDSKTFDPCLRLKESQRYGKASLKFRKYPRECPANEQAAKDGQRLIYDYEVVIDGAVRCRFISTLHNRHGNGRYQLFDAERRPIHSIRETRGHWPKHFGMPCESQAGFEPLIRQCLYEMLIPSVREQLEETQRLGLKDEELRAACEMEAQTHGLEKHARAMFDALASLIGAAEDTDSASKDFTPEQRTRAIEKARAAYFAAFDSGAACMNHEQEHRQIYLNRRTYS